MNNIPPITPSFTCQDFSVPEAPKSMERSRPLTSPFRAWTRAAGKTVGATFPSDGTFPLESSEAFWGQWSKKNWKAV